MKVSIMSMQRIANYGSFLQASFSNLWLTLVIRGLISCLIPNAVFWGLYHRLREFKECVKLVDKMTKRKFRLSGLILGEK